MKKILFILISLVNISALEAVALPDNVYFRAMKDEMDRTMKEYRIEKGPELFYMAYNLKLYQRVKAGGLFGKRVSFNQSEELQVAAQSNVGSYKNDSLGFFSDDSMYGEVFPSPRNYEGIRQNLWRVSDSEILKQQKNYEEKQAYKKQKQIKQDNFYDFAPVKSSSYVEELKEFTPPSRAYLENLVEKLSARGKDYSFIEHFEASVLVSNTTHFFLNSEGSFSQYSTPEVMIVFLGKVRHEKGYVFQRQERISFSALTPERETLLEQKADEFLQKLLVFHKAPMADAYIGPVLFKPAVAGSLIASGLDLANITPFFNSQHDTDPSASPLRDKVGMRIMSPGINVYDRPLLREYKGKPAIFSPMDDEGVLAQELLLVSKGKLKNLPLSRRSGKRGKSNGHGFGFLRQPREDTTTLVIEPENPLSQKELEEKLLTRCREQEQEYCYIAHDGSFFERIDMKSGAREFVLGLNMKYSATRALRDILAAGDDFDLKNGSVVPSLLVDEVELEPKEMIPERKPLIPRP